MKKSKLFITFLIINVILLIGSNNVLANTQNTNNIVLLANEAEVKCDSLFSDEIKADLENILKIMRIAAPLVVILFTTFEFISAMVSNDKEALNKAASKLVKRLVLVVLLFFLPMILNLLLSFIDAKYSTCIS